MSDSKGSKNRKNKGISPRKKLFLIQQVEEEKLSVSAVCKKADIARKTYYQWKARYDKAKERGEAPLKALAPKKKVFKKE